MKAYLSVKLALLPFVLFWMLAGAGHPLAGALAGAVLAAVALAYRVRSHGPVLLEATALLSLVPLALWFAGTDGAPARPGLACSFLALGAACAVSVVLRRPWTAAYAAAAWQGMASTPLFRQVNAGLSALWAVLFSYLGVAYALALGAAASWVPLALGVVASIALPRWIVRRALQARIDAQQGSSWPAPDFDAAAARDADVVVVGAGLGGLTAAALLAQSGRRVLVLEKQPVAGGFCHTWLRKGRDGDARPVFRFDCGVHDVSGWWDGAPVRGVFTRLGLLGRVRWRRMDHRHVTARGSFDVPRAWDEHVERLAAAFPASADGIRAAMADIRAIHAAMYSGAPANSGIPGAPATVAGMLDFARRHPLALRWLDQPFAAFLESHAVDAAARAALCRLSGYVTDDVAGATVMQMVPLFGYYLHGGHYPVGGSGVIADALVAAIERDGGHVRLRTPVRQVVVEGGRACGVRLADGQVLRAAAVIVNADFLQATRSLVDPAAWPARFRSLVDATRPSCSAFAVHLGVRGDFDGAKPIIHVASDSGHVEVVVTSLVDPTAAPRGYSCVELLRLVPRDEALQWSDGAECGDDAALRRSAAYAQRKKAVGDAMIALAEQALPGLRGRIVFRTDASPVTFRRYNGCSDGAIYGTAWAPGTIAAKSPLPGLLFAGAATHGAGVEAAVISGARAAEALVPGLLASTGSAPRRTAGRLACPAQETPTMAMRFDGSFLPAALLVLGLAGCGGGADPAGTTASPQLRSDALDSAVVAPAVVQLQRYQVDPAKIFVAGISSGGFAAVQMHMAHSSTFKGAAVYAGGVYWCAGAGGAASALANCGGLTLPSGQASYNSTLAASQAYLEQQSALGTIDPIANLAGQPVYLWSGTLDTTVHPLEMADLQSEYLRYGANVRFDNTFPAAHGWESPQGELDCGTAGSPFMVKCSLNGTVYDSVKTWLTMFLGPLVPRNDGKLQGALLTFDQTEFGASPNVSMSPTGTVFVPKSCREGRKCGFVLALHGCLQQSELIGDRWVKEAGINEWADTNGLVVLYPETIATSAPDPTNPKGCFDWWGYSNQVDPDYALKSGLQMSVLYRMVQRVTGQP